MSAWTIPGVRADRTACGFTLVELAIVMFIVSLLLGGMLLPLSAQQDVRAYGDTQKILAEARDALLGYAMANGRLPCPASSTSNGIEDPVGGSTSAIPCANPHNGFLPAATLGLTPVDSSGYLVDGWGSDSFNRVRYAVTTNSTSADRSNAFTTPTGMQTTGMTALVPDLQVCSTAVGMTNAGTADTAACATGSVLASDAVAVIYSLGKNGGTGGDGSEETHNPNPQAATAADRAFVAAPQGSTSDDQMLWLSKSILYNRLVAAGRLP